MPRRLRKTIDRISLRTMKTLSLKGCSELRVYLWCALPLPPDLPVQSSFLELFKRKLEKKIAHEENRNLRSYHQKKMQVQVFEKKLWKDNIGKWEEKRRKPGCYPSKVHNCRCLRRKLWKEKWMRKVGIQDRPSKNSFSLVLCHDSCAKR